MFFLSGKSFSNFDSTILRPPRQVNDFFLYLSDFSSMHKFQFPFLFKFFLIYFYLYRLLFQMNICMFCPVFTIQAHIRRKFLSISFHILASLSLQFLLFTAFLVNFPNFPFPVLYQLLNLYFSVIFLLNFTRISCKLKLSSNSLWWFPV